VKSYYGKYHFCFGFWIERVSILHDITTIHEYMDVSGGYTSNIGHVRGIMMINRMAMAHGVFPTFSDKVVVTFNAHFHDGLSRDVEWVAGLLTS
jgi:hypothetical protein